MVNLLILLEDSVVNVPHCLANIFQSLELSKWDKGVDWAELAKFFKVIGDGLADGWSDG